MTQSELAQLEVQAELDLLVESLGRWAAEGESWQPAAQPRSLIQRLLERTDSIRLRMEAPLVVATLGGTGTGKSKGRGKGRGTGKGTGTGRGTGRGRGVKRPNGRGAGK